MRMVCHGLRVCRIVGSRAPFTALIHLDTNHCHLTADPPSTASSCPTMSGKAPPRAPRALLHSFPPSVASTAPGNPTNPRLGATPPTGPRSLVSGQRPPPQGPKALAAKSNANNQHIQPNAISLPASPGPPPVPSARSVSSQKGKQVDVVAGLSLLSHGVGSSSSFEVKCSRLGVGGSVSSLLFP